MTMMGSRERSYLSKHFLHARRFRDFSHLLLELRVVHSLLHLQTFDEHSISPPPKIGLETLTETRVWCVENS